MIETEFDRRLRDWLEDGPGTPDARLLESVIEHARSHRQRRALRVRWSDLTSSWLTWSPLGRTLRLATVAAVIAVLAFTGGLYVGSLLPERSEPSPTPGLPSTAPATALPAFGPLATCPAGSNPDLRGPIDQARPPGTTFQGGAFDRQSGQIVVDAFSAVEPLSGDPDPGRGLWSFDVCANTWHRSGARSPLASGWVSGDSVLYDPVADRTLFFGEPFMSFDLDADLISRSELAPLPGSWQFAYRTATRALVGLEWTGHLWTYDPGADDWRQIATAGEAPDWRTVGMQLLAYDESVDRLIVYQISSSMRGGAIAATSATYEFDFETLTWTRPEIETPASDLRFGWGFPALWSIAFDEAHGRTVVFGAGRLAAYDASSHAWELLHDAPAVELWSPSELGHRYDATLVYDPVNARVVAVGGRQMGNDGFIDAGVAAFDLTSRAWIELLAPSAR